MRQLHMQQSGLNRIQAPVIAFDVVVILLRLSVIAEHLHFRGDSRSRW